MAIQTADPDEAADWATEHASEGGAGATPHLMLDRFTGPLDHLLTLARAHKIALSDISVAALVEQLATALQQAPANMPLGQKGNWVVMGAWLVQLRSLLLLPADAPAQQDAAADADQLRQRLVALEDIQARTRWLERQPQLGHDVFARRRPEAVGVSVEAGPAIDVVEFLWASLALFDDDPVPDTPALYRPVHLNLFAVAEARERIRQRLATAPEGASLEQLLPDPQAATEQVPRLAVRRRSAWSSTFIAILELAKQGEVTLDQGENFDTIHVALS